MDVKQNCDGSWCVFDGDVLLVGGLPSHAAAWDEVDRRTTRPNWKSSASQFRDLGSFDHGRITPWTNPKHCKGRKKKMFRRAHPIRSR
jgi:hypothetical protein